MITKRADVEKRGLRAGNYAIRAKPSQIYHLGDVISRKELRREIDDLASTQG